MKTVHVSIETGPRFRNPTWMLLIAAAYYLDAAVGKVVGWRYGGRVWAVASRALFYTKVRSD